MKENKLLMNQFVNRSGQRLMKMQLQFFAEGGEGGDGVPGDGGTDDETISFKNQSELDSWFDTKLSKSLETAQAKWQAESEKRIKEAEQKGQMTAEEKAQYELQQERDQLEADRLALKRDQAEATTIKKLATDKLPDGLSVVLNPLYGGEEKDLDEAYTSVSKAFRDAVEQAVNIRLAGSADKPAGASNASGMETMATKMAKEANGRNESHDDLWSKK
ncbi:DUF4355 domain-containing protein [Enterococcus italicus]|uniref:DUF4355 domain-containing protein n=1 Tax=Enterococcus italicus TaxID=246144 RepID=UPI002072C923|nr:DUF4355 domain-containing protein [Enterococcus italicus]MCM6930344.1 DUF4355 domain-containing protein [Enterococcus italicus]